MFCLHWWCFSSVSRESQVSWDNIKFLANLFVLVGFGAVWSYSIARAIALVCCLVANLSTWARSGQVAIAFPVAIALVSSSQRAKEPENQISRQVCLFGGLLAAKKGSLVACLSANTQTHKLTMAWLLLWCRLQWQRRPQATCLAPLKIVQTNAFIGPCLTLFATNEWLTGT